MNKGAEGGQPTIPMCPYLMHAHLCLPCYIFYSALHNHIADSATYISSYIQTRAKALTSWRKRNNAIPIEKRDGRAPVPFSLHFSRENSHPRRLDTGAAA